MDVAIAPSSLVWNIGVKVGGGLNIEIHSSIVVGIWTVNLGFAIISVLVFAWFHANNNWIVL